MNWPVLEMAAANELRKQPDPTKCSGVSGIQMRPESASSRLRWNVDALGQGRATRFGGRGFLKRQPG